MKEQAISKINKVGKVSYVIAVIAKVASIIALVVTILGAVVCFVLPKDTISVEMAGKMNLELNLEKFNISEQEIFDGLAEGELQIKKENFTIGSIGTDVSLNVFEQDYNPVEIIQNEKSVLMKLETENNSFTLRNIGFLLIMASVAIIITIVTLYFIEALCKAFKDCTSPFDENIIKKMRNLAISLIPFTVFSSIIRSTLISFVQGNVDISISIDLGIALVVLIVFVLVYIFKYGAVLQQESDETL